MYDVSAQGVDEHIIIIIRRQMVHKTRCAVATAFCASSKTCLNIKIVPHCLSQKRNVSKHSKIPWEVAFQRFHHPWWKKVMHVNVNCCTVVCFFIPPPPPPPWNLLAGAIICGWGIRWLLCSGKSCQVLDFVVFSFLKTYSGVGMYAQETNWAVACAGHGMDILA